MTTMTTTAALVQQTRPPWIHRRFLKDTKLRVEERYWRPTQQHEAAATTLTVIPEGVVWRRYLRLLQRLIDDEPSLKWILLESAAELMDWRNTSPCVETENGECIQEAAALQERNKIRKLVEEHAENVQTLCDLSVREEECDEWKVLEYSDLSVTDRSRHALFRAGRLLGATNVILLVNDKDEAAKEESEDLRVLCMSEFLILLGGQYPKLDMNELITLIKVCEESYSRRNSPTTDETAPMEMTEEQIQYGLCSGTLLRGRLEVTKANPKEAYISVGTDRYFVNMGLGNVARALHHDVVVANPLPESQWGRPVGRRRLVNIRTEDEDVDRVELEAPAVPSATVVSVVNSSRREFVATLVDEPTGDERALLVVPYDIRIPKIRIQSRGWPAYVNQRLLVELDGWEASSNYPSGHCVRIIGPIGNLETEIACILFEHEIQLEPFSAKALACLPPEGPEWTIPPSEIERRRDLRKSHRIFSVDPPGCQDIDDSMHAKVLPSGDIEVGVHIADVTYYVPHESVLDKEAQVRGTTFYLVDRRFDMLPSLLGSDLCSLHGNTDRLAVSVIWTFSSDLNVVTSCWYGRTVIHNCQAMTYEQAHNMLHDEAPDDPSQPPPPPLTAGAPVDPTLIGPLKQDLSILQCLTRKLRKDREKIGGAVDLSGGDIGTELKFVLDENGTPTKVALKKELEIHHTIAEMMILANQSVATKIYSSFPETSLLRIHRAVTEDRFEELESALKAAGIAFDGSTNMALAESLDKAKQDGKDNRIVNSLWQSLATRAMSEALYICTGQQEEGVGLSHYGLGIDKYTHFTSPIRRYADVVVHKQLLAALAIDNLDATPPTEDKIGAPRLVLDSVPHSSAISILKGEGLGGQSRTKEHSSSVEDNDNDDDDHFLDLLIEGASELALGNVDENKSDQEVKIENGRVASQDLVPYSGSDVGLICEGLNKQNRMAKLSSIECQRLFLSLYFSEHTEITQGVVTGLRVNGLIVYVPKFDLKGPLYVSDTDGNVQIDPALVGLGPETGLPPTMGFMSAPNCRRFPFGRCILRDSDQDESLEIVIPDSPKKCIFRPLDVVTVQISCDLSDVRARIPPPRFHLVLSIGQDINAHSKSSEPRSVISSMIREGQAKHRRQRAVSLDMSDTSTEPSMYEKLASLDIRPVLADLPPRRHQPKVRVETDGANVSMPGRKRFGGFQNPDTRAATQEAAIAAASEAASQRREAAMEQRMRRDEYDTSRAIEREATARMQRLAAQKRSTKRSKAK